MVPFLRADKARASVYVYLHSKSATVLVSILIAISSTVERVGMHVHFRTQPTGKRLVIKAFVAYMIQRLARKAKRYATGSV